MISFRRIDRRRLRAHSSQSASISLFREPNGGNRGLGRAGRLCFPDQFGWRVLGSWLSVDRRHIRPEDRTNRESTARLLRFMVTYGMPVNPNALLKSSPNDARVRR